MHIHLIGVSGTGMGSLAILLQEAGHIVTGSDVSFDPPVGPALREAGVQCFLGFDPDHLSPKPDLVVVGNVIRKVNPEAAEATRLGLTQTSMSAALREHFLAKRLPLVVAGTHGKTTTSAMCAWILTRAELEPGWFIGGLPKNLPQSAAIGRTKRSLARSTGPAPFVVEGDEYDSVYWIKRPKFLDYVGVSERDVVIITSVELDHIDIYPDTAAYELAFREMVRLVPEGGIIVADASHPRVRAIVTEEARARPVFYALEGDDTGDVTPTWLGAPAAFDFKGAQQFDLFAGGVSCGRLSIGVPGAHNVRNAVAAMAACVEGYGVEVSTARSAISSFEGVKRRQDLIGEPGGVRVYDDFAHHPTAVGETLLALRSRHATGMLWAVFEPRSATACTRVHQSEYARAFASADRVLFAPLGRSTIPEEERLDLAALVREIGTKAYAATSLDDIVDKLSEACPGDTIVILSNGAFGGLHARVLALLEGQMTALRPPPLERP